MARQRLKIKRHKPYIPARHPAPAPTLPADRTVGWLHTDHTATIYRRPEFWATLPGDLVACTLCYRNCVIEPGEAGWCKYRVNEEGRLVTPAHGVISMLQMAMSGYATHPLLFFKPGQPAVYLGATYCTSDCHFCSSGRLVWRPWTLDWGPEGEGRPAEFGSVWGFLRKVVPPGDVVELARRIGAGQIHFGMNEPTLSIEYTLDVARRAKRAGLDVTLLTNGFTSPGAVRTLAPYVDAIELGVKGSGDPEFYRRWMRAEGAMDAVKVAAKTWREAGVHVQISDVIAPPHMQTDAAAEEAMRRLYGWIADELGPLTPVRICHMRYPEGIRRGEGKIGRAMLPPRADEGQRLSWIARPLWAEGMARQTGLPYAHIRGDDRPIRCHNCGEVLLDPRQDCRMEGVGACLMVQGFCPFWGHEQHVTAGRCDHCQATVPVIALSEVQLAASWALARSRALLQTDHPEVHRRVAALEESRPRERA